MTVLGIPRCVSRPPATRPPRRAEPCPPTDCTALPACGQTSDPAFAPYSDILSRCLTTRESYPRSVPEFAGSVSSSGTTSSTTSSPCQLWSAQSNRARHCAESGDGARQWPCPRSRGGGAAHRRALRTPRALRGDQQNGIQEHVILKRRREPRARSWRAGVAATPAAAAMWDSAASRTPPPRERRRDRSPPRRRVRPPDVRASSPAGCS